MFDQWADQVREHSRWATDFGTGGTILQDTSDAIRSCRAGLFLFTKDDPLEGEDTMAAPRDNVVLEAGLCIATRGSRRTVIIREHGAKMPADLGGIIYLGLTNRNDISSIQEPLRRALEKSVDRNGWHARGPRRAAPSVSTRS